MTSVMPTTVAAMPTAVVPIMLMVAAIAGPAIIAGTSLTPLGLARGPHNRDDRQYDGDHDDNFVEPQFSLPFEPAARAQRR